MSPFLTLKKLIKRKRTKGYYNSDYIISTKEKENLVIISSILLIPIIIGIILIIFN